VRGDVILGHVLSDREETETKVVALDELPPPVLVLCTDTAKFILSLTKHRLFVSFRYYYFAEANQNRQKDLSFSSLVKVRLYG
jgi:hypothetical protein